MKKHHQVRFLSVIKRFCLIFIPFVILTSFFAYYSYRSETTNRRNTIEIEEMQVLKHLETLTSYSFKVIAADLRFLSRQQTLQKLLDGNISAVASLANDWRLFAESKAIYDQIRFLDSSGQEVVRVNYNNGKPVIVLANKLQNKANRYYFQETLRLEEGNVFVSPFDLNIEHGQIEQPLKPMIRFGVPIFDRQGQKRGIVLVNYLGNHLINTLLTTQTELSHKQNMLLNSDGFWLVDPDPSREWGFMYGNDKTFGKAYPQAWSYMQGNEQGQFVSKSGLFSFLTIHPLSESWPSYNGAAKVSMEHEHLFSDQPFHWKAVTFIPTLSLEIAGRSLRNKALGLFLLFIVSLGTVSWLLALAWTKRSLDFVALAKSEQELRNSSLRYQDLSLQFQGVLEGIDDSLLILDAGLAVIWDNNHQRNEDDSESGKPILQEILTTERRTGQTIIAHCLQSRASQQTQTSDNKGKSWMIRAVPIKDNQDAVVNVVLIAQDITEFQRLQAQNTRTSQLANLGEMAAGVAHEINNPICGVINYAQILKNRSQGNEEVADLATRIITEGDRIATIVRTLLFAARGDSTEMSTVTIPEVMSDVMTLSQSQLEQAEIHLSLNLPDSLPVVLVNSQQLQQVFLNIINNARHALDERYPASDKNKILEITGKIHKNQDHQYVRIVFTDHGTGIPEDLIGRVMMPFFTTKPAGVGTGLGLSLSHEIINKHGGHLYVESEESEFTRVIVDLPIN